MRFTKTNNMETKLSTKVPAVETPVEAKAIEPVAVETVVKAPEEQAKKIEAEATPVAVEAIKTVEKAPAVEVTQVAEAMALSKAVDPREEFKRFTAMFGMERAATYFSLGKSYDEALAEHVKYQAEEIKALSKRLTSIDRGAEKPLKLSADTTDEKSSKVGLASIIKVK